MNFVPKEWRRILQLLRNATYKQDGLLTKHNADFMKDPLFMRAYAAGKSTGSWRTDIHWRVYVACWAADKARSLEGDFVECGVNKGGMSRAVIEYIEFGKTDKRFYLLDTFHGLADEYISEKERGLGIEPGGYEECYEQVREAFDGFPVEIIKGTVPDTLPKVKARKVAYLSIDMNCVEPEIAAANYFWDKLVPGGVIVLDDYGWAKHIEQKLAFDRFARDKRVQVLSLPTGQGLIFKP